MQAVQTITVNEFLELIEKKVHELEFPQSTRIGLVVYDVLPPLCVSAARADMRAAGITL